MPFYDYYEDDQILYKHQLEEKPNLSDFSSHIHDQCEILYFVKGKASYIVETNQYPLIPDTLVLMRPMESHTLHISPSEPYERFMINFSVNLINDLDPTHRLLAPFFERPSGSLNSYASTEFAIPPIKLFSAMNSRTETEGDKLMIMSNLYALLVQINDAFMQKKNNESPPPEKRLVTEIADYINAHLFEDLSVQSLSDKFYISVSQLNRKFISATGFSVWKYVLSKRLISARNLIYAGTPATHAYLQCGFNDYSSFYRLYTKRFNSSPKDDFIKNKPL